MARRPLVLVVLGCAVVAAATYAVALGTVAGGRVDAAVLDALAGLGGSAGELLASDLVRFFDPAQFACLGAALVCVALARSRPRHALMIVVVLGGAALTSQLLKSGLATARPYPTATAAPIGLASWPSGHTTGATALALCLVLVAPPRLRRPAVTVAGAIALLVPLSLLVLPSHWPSDVLGGICVAIAWFSLGLLALGVAERRVPAIRPRALLVPGAALVLACLGAIVAIALARPGAAAGFVQNHTTLTMCVIALAAAGATVVGSAAMALREP